MNPLAAVFSLGFVVAGFVLLLIYERSGNIKHLQLVCGMRKTLYWLCAYFWDLIWYFIFCVLVMVLFLAFKDPYFTGSEELPLFFLVLVLYGLAATPWMYVWSFLFASPATAYIFLSCLNFFSGFAFLIVDFILVQLQSSDSINLILVWIPFPAYQLGRTMMYLSLDRPLMKSAAPFTSNPIPNVYSDLYPFLLSMLIQSCIYSILVFFIESRSLITNNMYVFYHVLSFNFILSYLSSVFVASTWICQNLTVRTQWWPMNDGKYVEKTPNKTY